MMITLVTSYVTISSGSSGAWDKFAAKPAGSGDLTTDLPAQPLKHGGHIMR